MRGLHRTGDPLLSHNTHRQHKPTCNQLRFQPHPCCVLISSSPCVLTCRYLAVAILARQRRHILEGDLDFDGLLKLCVDLAGQVDLEQALADAEALREFAGEAGRQVVAALP